MKVVTTFYPPSSVSTSVKCHLDPNSDDGHLVVAKANQILVYSLNPEGLKHECALEIWGHVLVLRAIPVEVRASLFCLFGCL